MDDAFAQVCANVYGNGEGTTAADLVGVTALNDSSKNLVSAMSGNTTVTTMDFRQFPKLGLRAKLNWNQQHVQNVYISTIERMMVCAWNGLGPTVNGKPHVDKLIIGEMIWADTTYPNTSFLSGDTDSNCSFGTIAIRNIHVPSNATKI